MLPGLLILFPIHADTTQNTPNGAIKVKKATNKIHIDGLANDSDWKQARSYPLSNFYRVNKSTDQQKSHVKMLWDDSIVYFYFQAEDNYLTSRETERDGLTYLDDCFEVFLMPSASPIKLHFGFEVNINKASNDFIWLNDFYQNERVSIKSYNPDFQVETYANGTVNDNSDIDVGWSVELAIPIDAFKSVSELTPLQEGSTWNILIVRQDRNDATGGRTSLSTIFPLSEEENVHAPEIFGLIQFVAQ